MTEPSPLEQTCQEGTVESVKAPLPYCNSPQALAYRSLYDNAKKYFNKNWFVDTSASILFWVPTYGTLEYLKGEMESDEIARSRLAAIGWNIAFGRVTAIAREQLVNYCGADHTSSRGRKWFINTGARILTHMPIYATILLCSGAEWDEFKNVWPYGVAFGALLGHPYGRFLDSWRKRLGTNPILHK